MRKHRHAAQRLQEHTTNTENANAKSAEHSTKADAAITQKTKHPCEVLFLYPKAKRGDTMGRTVNALKALGKKCSTEQTVPNGKTISAVLESIEDNFDITGASVTAITLYTTEGAVTGGTATLSNGSTVNITVTTAPQT